MKISGSTGDVRWELRYLSHRGEVGISSVGVKSVDIRKNTGGEGELLAND